jgi:periplasmic copper chaperone A
MKSFVRAIAAALLAISSSSFAHDFKVGDIKINHPFATPTRPGASTGAAYVSLENKGKAADKLIKAASPVAGIVELHEMKMQGDLMKMAEVPAVEVKPGATVKMRPGNGYHFMLMQLKQPLKDGETFPMTLEFEKAGKVEVKVYVQQPKKGEAEHKHH